MDPRFIEMALPGGAQDAPRATGVDAGDPPEERGGCGRAELGRLAGGGARATTRLRKGTLAKGTARGLARAGGFEGNLIKGTNHPLPRRN